MFFQVVDIFFTNIANFSELVDEFAIELETSFIVLFVQSTKKILFLSLTFTELIHAFKV
jgi:hypothetical protein